MKHKEIVINICKPHKMHREMGIDGSKPWSKLSIFNPYLGCYSPHA